MVQQHIHVDISLFITPKNTENNFLIYNNNCEKNILFIGSCRLASYMFYYNNLNMDYMKRNIYGVYISNCSDNLHLFPKEKLIDILKNTDIIICENIVNYDILNTNIKSDINFFKEFNTSDKKIIHIPNLELRMYTYDIIHTFKQTKEEVYDYFLKSKQHLYKLFDDTGYEELKVFIDTNLNKIRLFNTFNHPSNTLSIVLFKYLMKHAFNINIQNEFLNTMHKYCFLEGNCTPIFDNDIMLYNIEYRCNISDNNLLHTPNIYINNIHINTIDFNILNT